MNEGAPISSAANKGLRKLLLDAKLDDVLRASRQDVLVMEYGSRLYNKHGHLAHRHKMIVQRIRQLGQLLLNLPPLAVDQSSVGAAEGSDQLDVGARATNQSNSISLIPPLLDFIHPGKFRDLVHAAKRTCEFIPELNKYGRKKSSRAFSIGYAIKHCADIVHTNAIKAGQRSRATEALSFITLFEKEWQQEVGHIISYLPR